MSTMFSEVYDALKEAIAGYENRFTKIDQDMAVIKWMSRFNLAFTSVILWKVFST